MFGNVNHNFDLVRSYFSNLLAAKYFSLFSSDYKFIKILLLSSSYMPDVKAISKLPIELFKVYMSLFYFVFIVSIKFYHRTSKGS